MTRAGRDVRLLGGVLEAWLSAQRCVAEAPGLDCSCRTPSQQQEPTVPFLGLPRHWKLEKSCDHSFPA